MYEKPDAIFVQPNPDETAEQWEKKLLEINETWPDWLGIVIYFGRVWNRPGGEPHTHPFLRPDGNVSHVHRFPKQTMKCVRAMQEKGRKVLCYVNPWRFKIFYERELQSTAYQASLALMSFYMEKKAEGWDGIYADGIPPMGFTDSTLRISPEDIEIAKEWMQEKDRQWPGGFDYLHSSALDEPILGIHNKVDICLFGEVDGPEGNRIKWTDPGIEPLFYGLKLRKMGTNPVYKVATKTENRDEVHKKWFEALAGLNDIGWGVRLWQSTESQIPIVESMRGLREDKE